MGTMLNRKSSLHSDKLNHALKEPCGLAQLAPPRPDSSSSTALGQIVLFTHA